MCDDVPGGERRGIVIDMATRGAKKPAAQPKSATKDKYLMVRVDDEQKARIAALADAEEETMSNYIRGVIRKLAKGWRLIPPE